MTSTMTRKAELEQKIAELEELERTQGEVLLREANVASLEAAGIWDSHKADAHRLNQTKQAVMKKRSTHTQKLRAEAELEALLMAEAKDSPQLAEDREELARIDAEIDKLESERQEVQARVWQAESEAKQHELAYWRLTHEADSFEQGSEALG